MMIRSLKRTCTKSATNEKSGWLWRAGNRQLTNQRGLERRNRGPSDDPERQSDRKSNQALCVEGIEVSVLAYRCSSHAHSIHDISSTLP